jgi:hypothetical protein
MMGSKAIANITSEIKYKIIITGHPIPIVLASKTPPGISPPIGTKKRNRTSQRFDR